MEEKQNQLKRTVLLIGPPDCGKTTLGELAAQELGVPFKDVDREVAKKFIKQFPEGSALDLMHHYPELEAEVLKEVVFSPDLIILATGAETALFPKNSLMLPLMGYIILIRRDKEALKEEMVREDRRRWIMTTPEGGKKEGVVTDMYFNEMVIYESLAEAVLENDFGIEQGTAALLEIIKAIPAYPEPIPDTPKKGKRRR